MMDLAFWATTLSLTFGGCCSNALTLEQVTSEHPRTGTLITFLQFLLISIHGLFTHVTFSSPQASSGLRRLPYPRLKPRKLPIKWYFVQVFLFYAVNLLNNTAFRYGIPMTVHIIFRSAGLLVSMLLGWAFAEKTYTRTQVLSVLIIAAGVAITTLSASQNPSAVSSSEPDGYYTGITFLVLALFISGTLGIVQEWTYTQCHHQASDPGVNGAAIGHFEPIPWQESLFYLHFLALPMFIALGPDILNQLRSINTSPHVEVPVTIPPWVLTRLPALQLLTPKFTPLPLGLTVRSHSLTLTLSFPRSYLPLLLNALTQLVCVAGVNRLTTNVSNLTVTLILAVRKAVSVLLSVILFDRASASNGWMWFGAALVSLGTVGYASERMDDGFREKND